MIEYAKIAISKLLDLLYWYKNHDLQRRQVESEIQIDNIDFRSYIDFVPKHKWCFELDCEIKNKNPASGSITSPQLVIKYPDDMTEIIHARLDPIKSILDRASEPRGEVVYLKGGEIEIIRFYYYLPLDTALLNFNIYDPDYSLRYRDNLGREKEIPIKLKRGEYLDG